MGTSFNTRHSASQKELVAADIGLSAGWGTAPVKALAAGSNARFGELTITCDATAGANPTVTITFPDGAANAAPFVIGQHVGGDDQLSVAFRPTSRSTTAVVFTFDGTPVATKLYKLAWHAMGE